MAKTDQTADQSSLGNEFEGVVSRRNGRIVVDISSLPEGALIDVIMGNKSVDLLPPANDDGSAVNKKAYNIGDTLSDGWVVGPVSPTTGHVMSIEPADRALSGLQRWQDGEDHAEYLKSQGHINARQADTTELNALYNDVVKADLNEAAKFETGDGQFHSGHWASSDHKNGEEAAQIQFMDNGRTNWGHKMSYGAHVRCVRDEPDIELNL